MSNPCLEAIMSELDAVGVPYRVDTGSRHVHVYYGTDYQHMHVCAKTPSDYRAPMNERAQIRRDLVRLGFVQEAEKPFDALVTLRDGIPSVASYHIADHFSKAHKDVLRAIDRIRDECGPEFDRRNFTPIDYLDGKGRTYRAYSLTHDGFTLVVMGFTGRAATECKIRYIEAFNALEAQVRTLSSSGAQLVALRSEIDAAVSLIAEVEARVANVQPSRSQPFIRPSILRKLRRMG